MSKENNNKHPYKLAFFPEKNPNPVMAVDLSGRVIYKNPASITLFPTISDNDFKHPWLEDLQEIFAAFEKGKRKSLVREIKIENIWYQQALYFEIETRFVHIYGLNITEKKLGEEALKDSEQNFKNLYIEYNTFLNAIPDMLLVISPDLEILWGNSEAAKTFGKEKLVPHSKCYHTICDLDKPYKNCPALKAFSTGKIETHQLSTGDNCFFDVKVNPIKDEDGKIVKAIIVASDITEKITLQKEAMRASHLASIGELAAGVAHEINNPTTGIIYYAQILSDKLEEDSKEHYISKEIITEGERIASIVKGLLSFARGGTREKFNVHIKEIFSSSIELTMSQMKKDGIEIKVHIPDELPSIYAQPNQMQQVFLNLLSNSRYALNKKFPSFHKEKKLSVSAEEIKKKNDNYVKIQFYDSGCGISSEIIDKVMDPFFTSKPLGEGTGLGLSISYGIISDHNGNIKIESVENEYTKIIITLPLLSARKN